MKLELPKADKSLGQHFLRDSTVIHAICSDFPKEAQAIVEIGPGPGILTEFLATRSKEEDLPFFVVEKDTRFPEYLEQFIKNNQITITDALALDLGDFFIDKRIEDKNIWLVSNLPYNIGTPLLINFLLASEIKMMTLMFQKEVADKVFPFATTKNFMGSLHALTNSYFECELLCRVPPGAFAPAPKVDSAVLSMRRRENPLVPLVEFRAYEKFLRKLFIQKRKQLGGVLKAHYPVEEIQQVFGDLNIPLTIRSEALTFQNVLDLYQAFKK